MNNKKYNLANLLDIARLPEDAFERFIKEMPEMIGMIRKIDRLNHKEVPTHMDDTGTTLSENDQKLLKNIIWKDDGEQDFQVRVRKIDGKGNEHILLEADSRTRDVAVYDEGKDVTFDVQLAIILRETFSGIEDDEILEMMPEGKLVIPADKVRSFHIHPAGLKELCIGANRQFCISNANEHTPLIWLENAKQI